MIGSVKAETRKLLTIRSTYYLVIAILLLVMLIGGFFTGYRIIPPELHNHGYFVGQVFGAMGLMSILIAVIGLLGFGHEYRYNYIMYTLTLSKSRSATLLAKLLVTSALAVVLSLIVTGLVIASTIVGIQLHGYHLVSQTINYGEVIWRAAYCAWGFSMIALILVGILRNQVGAIVAFLLFPTTIENIAGLLLKSNSQYLPFTALVGVVARHQSYPGATVGKSVAVSLLYIVVGWVVTWYLFLRRDAN